MNANIPQYIGITELRANSREIFDAINQEKRPVIVLRDSKPAGVILSYEEYEQWMQERRQLWNERLDALISDMKPAADRWMKKKGYNPKTMTSDKALEILEREDDKAGR